MKQKIAIALAALSLMAMLSACDMGNDETSSINGQNNTSSVSGGNIPEDNKDGEYDDDKDNNDSSKTLEDDISSIVSSGNSAINSMMDK